MHSQRRKNCLASEFRERLTAQPSHNLTHQNEIDVAINEADARRSGWLIDKRALDAGLITAPGGFQIEIRPEPGKMGHQVPDSNFARAALKLGQVFRDWIVKPDLALFEKFHDAGRSGNDLGQ